MVIQHPSARQGSSPTSTAVSGGTNLKHGRASRYRYISIVTSLLIAVMAVMAFSPFFHGNLVSSSAVVHEIAPVMMTPSLIRQAMIPLSSPEGDDTSLMTVRGDEYDDWFMQGEGRDRHKEGTLRHVFKTRIEKQKKFCSKMGDELPRIVPVNVSSNGNASVAVLERIDSIWSMDGFEQYSLYALQSFNENGMADIVSHSLHEYGQWEGGEIQSIIYKLDAFAESQGLSRSEVYFVDIGANVGTFSFAIAMMGFQVLAFEALQVNQEALRMSLCANPQLIESIAIFNTALGKDKATCQMFSDPQNILDGAVACGPSKKPPFAFLVWRQQLDIVRLDDVLDRTTMANLTGKVGAVKMDTEGFEPWVIQGGRRFFNTTKPRYFVTELNPPPLKAATNTSSLDFIRQIQSFGYSLRNGSFDSPVLSKRTIRRAFSRKNEHLTNLYFTMEETL
ncbi:hypothetical protein PSENEW3_00001646 [Picochlorum sp. SENEW3]|nr:hypothetical protein PSENEW3_00001646 [Picochlorum sp. SENEW3]